MGSINLAGTAYAESYIEGPFPAGPWSFVLHAKLGGPAANTATGPAAMLLGDYLLRPSFNIRNDSPDIRYGTYNSSTGVFSSVDTNDDIGLYYCLSSPGGASGVRFTISDDDGVIESYEVTDFPPAITDADLVYFFLGTIGGASGAHNPALYTRIKIYERDLWSSGAGSGADIVAQGRTRATLWPADLFAAWDWDGSTTTGINVADEGSHTFETWVSTGVTTDAWEPAYPDDASGADHEFGGESVGTTVGVDSGSLAQLHAFAGVDVGCTVGVDDASLNGDYIGEPRDDACISYSGHSLQDQPIPDYVQLIADGFSRTIDWQRQFQNGSTINNRSWNGGSNSGYLTGYNRDGTIGLNLITHYRNVTAVSGKETNALYTADFCAENHTTLANIEYEATVRVFRQRYELIREGSPNCQGYLYSAWLDKRNADIFDWIQYARETDNAHAAIVSRVNLSLEYESRSDRVMLFPASGGMAELVERAITDTGVPGITVFDGPSIDIDETLAVIFSDNVHPTDLGKYFLACLVYGAAYRRDPRGADYPVEITLTQAESLQSIAWDVLVATYGDAPYLGPQYANDDQQTAVVEYVPDYVDFVPGGDPGDIPGLESYFGGTSSDLYFNPPTTESIWLAPPDGDADHSFGGTAVGVVVGVDSAALAQLHAFSGVAVGVAVGVDSANLDNNNPDFGGSEVGVSVGVDSGALAQLHSFLGVSVGVSVGVGIGRLGGTTIEAVSDPIYTRLAETATRLIGKYGETVTFRSLRNTGGQPWAPTQTTTETEVKMIFFLTSRQGREHIANAPKSEQRRGSHIAYMPTENGIAISGKDFIVRGDEKYRILNVQEYRPATKRVMWLLELERQ